VDLLAYGTKVIIIFLIAYFGTRVLSKKAIAEMTAYEIAGIFILSNVAAEPLVTKVTMRAVLGTGLLVFLIWLASHLATFNKLTPIMEHSPTVVIKNGQLDMTALRAASLSLNQFMGLLRAKGFDKVTDVEFAILEPQGMLSAFPKSQKRPVNPGDLNIPTPYEGLTLPLVMDGSVIENNLRHANLTKEWLLGALSYQGIKELSKEVALAELDTQGNLLVSRK